MPMGRYVGGDVLLAPVRIGGLGEEKVRPVVVIAAGEDGGLIVCPVSSSPSSDGPSVPLSLNDFARGGLDLFAESYVLAAHPSAIRAADVVGKKGTLLPEALAAIRGAIPAVRHPRDEKRRRG